MRASGRRARAVLAAVALLTALAPPGTASADHAGSCERVWPRDTTCLFYMRGFPITVEGEALATGTARIHVQVEATSINGEPGPVLLECSAQRAARASCYAEITPGRTVDFTSAGRLTLL
ncbi:MAG TPA: hypothetical protein VM600_08005, partial [Actinomycetota bacterium]|nr:hypothetical protein [Actinomycetota bacterium]